MLKKLLLIFGLFLVLFSSAFSTNISISQCPTLWNNNTNYIIANNYIESNCQILGENISLTTNNIDIKKNLRFTLISNSSYTFKNIVTNSLNINLVIKNEYKNINLINNTLNNQVDHVIFLYSPSNAIYSTNISNLNFYHNYIKFNSINANLITHYLNTASSYINSRYLNITNLNLTDNDIFGKFNYLIYGYSIYYAFGSQAYNFIELNNVVMNNNILAHRINLFAGVIKLNVCSPFLQNNNYFDNYNAIDLNLDKINDNNVLSTLNNCNYYNNNPIVMKNFNTKPNTQIYNYLANSPQYYDSNKRIYLDKTFLLNGLTTGLDFSNIIGTTLDLSLMPSQTALTLGAIRTLKMGTNNKIYGGVGLKPIIDDNSPIITNYVGGLSGVDYSTNYHLIEYDNGLSIENIDFELNFGQYALIRKSSLQVDGINLNLNNNMFNVWYNQNNLNMPFIVSGCKLKATNNYFDNNLNQRNIFSDGRCGTTSGGHIIQNNTFSNGGYAFQGLQSTTFINLPSLFNNNNFIKSNINSLYGGTFNTNINPLIKNISLNGDYFYKTTCQNYKFNIGNRYQANTDLVPLNSTNDVNNDKIYDFNLTLGIDLNNLPIKDNKPLGVFPYPFTSQIANAVSVSNSCGAINFNSIKPIQNGTYPSNSTFTTNWEFVSNTYNNLYCKENLNGIEVQYITVNSGINKGATYSVSDGIGNFQIICSNTDTYSDIVLKSEIYKFKIGNLNSPIIVQPNPSINIFGCNVITAINYNPLANINDGSCIFSNNNNNNNTNNNNTNTNNNNTNNNNNNNNNNNGINYTSSNPIDFSSVANTNQNTIGFMGDIISFIVNVGVPLAILIIIIVIFLAVVRLIF